MPETQLAEASRNAVTVVRHTVGPKFCPLHPFYFGENFVTGGGGYGTFVSKKFPFMLFCFCPGALMEYAVILLMLKKRRKPMRTIDQGLRHLFAASNGAAAAASLANPNARQVRDFSVDCWTLFLLLF